MSDLRLSTSPAPNRRLPRPPPAAPAAGGRGNPDSRRVHSVGKRRVSSRRRRGGGGVAGVVLQVVDLPVDGGAPRSSGVDLLPLSSWRFCGAAGFDFPSPDSAARRRIWLKLNKQWKKLVWFGSTTTTSSGVGPLGPAIGDFPFVRGLLSIQGIKESRSDGAPPTAPWMAAWSSCREAWAVIFLSCEDLSVILPN